MNKVEYWFFEIEHKDGKREIVGYGNSEYYTQEEATKGMMEVCKSRGYRFIGIHKEA